MLDVHWSEAVLAIASQDSARFAGAIRALADTSERRQLIARGLRALWRERVTGLVDSLIAHDDHTMRTETTFMPTVPLSRLAIGRSLTVSGDPRRAEHYLQWTDGRLPMRRSAQVMHAFMPFTSYQRGLAAEAAGDRRAAILHLRRFVDAVDRPPSTLAQQLADARSRLARLLARDP
jgi:hypothetical protein